MQELAWLGYMVEGSGTMDQPTVYEGVSEEARVGGVLVSELRFLV